MPREEIFFELIIPAHNESLVILETVNELKACLSKLNLNYLITVADNCSSDGTDQVVKKANIKNCRVVLVSEKGKGAAIVNCAKNTKANLFGFIDADLSADPKHIGSFVEEIILGRCDVVVGSRFHSGSRVKRGFLRDLLSRTFVSVRSLFVDIDVIDSQCGLKIMNKKGITVLAMCEERTWFFDLEFLDLAKKVGLNVKEMPVEWDEFVYKNRKSKINILRDGFLAMLAFVRIYYRNNLKHKWKRKSL